MFVIDRTVKLLLVAVVMLLAVNAGTQVIQPAGAQTANSPSTVMEAGWLTEIVSAIPIKKEDRVNAIHVMDQAQSFVIQYENRIEVYRVRSFNVSPDMVRRR